jgi:ribose transport system ATP-binding protein
LRIESLSKHFGGVQALAAVDMEVEAGEIRGLVGENGSGKSSLVKILSGYHTPDEGRVWLWGKELSFPVRSTRTLGLEVVHQDLGLVPTMSVVENFGVGADWGSSPPRGIRWSGERALWRSLSARFGLEIDPDSRVGDLSPADRAMLAILRAVRQLELDERPPLLILDEPTAYLTSADVAQVVALMRSVRKEGASVIFISHRLKEVIDVSDRVSVIRDGRMVSTVEAERATQANLIRLMLGRDLGDFYPSKNPSSERETALRARNITGERVQEFDVDLREGEIVGVTGLAGMGQDELPYLLGGAQRAAKGTIELRGGRIKSPSVSQMLAKGVVLVPANRQRDGVWLSATALENITLPFLGEFFRGLRLRRRAQVRQTAETMVRFGVRPPVPHRVVGSFSGGNQQKIVLAKWLQSSPRVLLLHEPTQGVDAGARKDILQIVKDVASQGAAILVASAEYEQLALVCHRVLILHDGNLVETLAGSEVTEDRILESCHAGGVQASAVEGASVASRSPRSGVD